MGWLISSSTTLNSIHTVIPCSFSAADRIKAVHYEGDGFCLLYKRHESGRLQWPRISEEAKQISEQQLRWLLEGLNPEQQIRLLEEQVDFLSRKLFGTKSEKTSTLEIEGQMSLFNEAECYAAPSMQEPGWLQMQGINILKKDAR